MEAPKIDARKLAKALREVLEILPPDAVPANGTIQPAELKRLRTDVDAAAERLLALSRALDPIQQPAFVFDPTNPEQIGKLIGRTMMEQPRHPMGTVPKFYGSGAYVIK